VDSFEPKLKFMGLETLHHAIENVNPTELRWEKQSVLDTLISNLYTKEKPVLKLLFPILKTALITIYPIPTDIEATPLYHKVLISLIEDLERVTDRELRSIYFQSLQLFIPLLGLQLVQYFSVNLHIIIPIQHCFLRSLTLKSINHSDFFHKSCIL
jgi:hypothetical protein